MLRPTGPRPYLASTDLPPSLSQAPTLRKKSLVYRVFSKPGLGVHYEGLYPLNEACSTVGVHEVIMVSTVLLR